MKKLMSNVLLVSTMLSTNPMMSNVYAQATPDSTVVAARITGENSFSVLFENYKKSVIKDGKNVEIASTQFIRDVRNSGLTLDDIKGYALKNMSLENYTAFNKTLDSGIMSLNGNQISEKRLARVIENLVKAEKREEANWISCGAGLGVGIPLLVAGIVTGIVALSLSEVQTNEVQKKYIDLRKSALDKYTGEELKRQDRIVALESDIDFYNNELDELQRRIDSGIYGAIEVEQMRQDMAVINTNISDANASIAQLVNDQPQLYTSYEQDIANLNELEANELSGVEVTNERKQRQKKVLGLTTALTMPIGLALTLGGAKDC